VLSVSRNFILWIQNLIHGFPANHRMCCRSPSMSSSQDHQSLPIFLEMINFYRHFLSYATSIQAPLHGVLSAPKSRVPILLPGPTHSPQPATSEKNELVSSRSPGAPRPNHSTSTGHGRFNHRQGWHSPTEGAKHQAAPRLLQEAESSTKKIQRSSS